MPIYEVQQGGKTYEVDAPTPEALKKLLGQTLPQTNPGEYDPTSEAYQKKYGPLSTTGNFQNFRAGYGKGAVDLGRGVAQFFGGGPSEEQVDEQRRLDAPLMNTKAGFAGNLSGAVATAAPTMFIPGANTYGGSAAIGAALGALQPVGTKDSRFTNTALGAAGGLGGKYVGDKVLNWAARPAMQTLVDEGAGLSQTARDIMQRGEAVGMKSTPGQASGSRSLQQLEAKWESQPLTSGPFNAIKENNAKALNRAFLKAIGENGDEVSADVLNKADQRIGQAFENAAKNNKIAYDNDLQQALSGIEAAAATELEPQSMTVISKQLGNILDKASATGSLEGQQFQNIRQSLTRLSGSGNSSVGYWARQIRESLDDALERSMGQTASKEIKEARGQYRILATALNRTGAINPKGTVQPGILANALAQSDKAGYLLGRNQSQLYNALRFAQAFKPIVGDSGTATRSAINGLGDAGIRGMNAILARAYLSKPTTAGAAFAGPALRGLSNAARKRLGTAPFYAPFLLPSTGGVVLPQLVGK